MSKCAIVDVPVGGTTHVIEEAGMKALLIACMIAPFAVTVNKAINNVIHASVTGYEQYQTVETVYIPGLTVYEMME